MPRHQPVASFHQDARTNIGASRSFGCSVNRVTLSVHIVRAHIRIHVHIWLVFFATCIFLYNLCFIVLARKSFNRKQHSFCLCRNNRSDRLRIANIFISFLIYIVACLSKTAVLLICEAHHPDGGSRLKNKWEVLIKHGTLKNIKKRNEMRKNVSRAAEVAQHVNMRTRRKLHFRFI